MAPQLPVETVKIRTRLRMARRQRQIMCQIHVRRDGGDAISLSEERHDRPSLFIPGQTGCDGCRRQADVGRSQRMRLGVKAKKPHVVGNDDRRFGGQQASAVRLGILDPGGAGLARPGITPIFIQENDGGAVMPDFARGGTDGILQVGHYLINPRCQRLCLAGPDHFGENVDLRIATRRLKPHAVGHRPDADH